MELWKPMAVAGLLAVSACTVQPLNAPQTANGIAATGNPVSVMIDAADDRVELEVRERLLFRLSDGVDPASADHALALTTSAATTGLFRVSGSSTGQTTASTTTVTLTASLTDTSDGSLKKRFRAVATASSDLGSQQFANERAQRDAELRAARAAADSLATQIRTFLRTNG